MFSTLNRGKMTVSSNLCLFLTTIRNKCIVCKMFIKTSINIEERYTGESLTKNQVKGDNFKYEKYIRISKLNFVIKF